jgi:YHS domain-containing protein
MNRRTLLKRSMTLGLMTAIPTLAAKALALHAQAQAQDAQKPQTGTPNSPAAKTDDIEKTCLVCGMPGSPEITSVYKKKTYYFCMTDDKATFDASPEEYVKTAAQPSPKSESPSL